MTAREWLEIVAIVLAWTSPVWLPAAALGFTAGWFARRRK